MHELLLGEHGFYDEIFTVAADPVRAGALGARRRRAPPRARSTRPPGCVELIHAYRVRGHLMADTDPLEFEIRRHPDLDVLAARADPVGPGPRRSRSAASPASRR